MGRGRSVCGGGGESMFDVVFLLDCQYCMNLYAQTRPDRKKVHIATGSMDYSIIKIDTNFGHK